MASQSNGHGAAASLRAADQARDALVGRVSAPAWYPAAVGGLIGQHVLAQGAADQNWTLPSGALLLVGSAAAWLLLRARMGVTVGAWTGWRSLLMLGALSVFAFACVTVAASWEREGPGWLLAAASVLGSAGLCWGYLEALRSDARSGDGPVGP